MKFSYSDDIVIIGLGRFGQSIVDELLKLNKKITIIDSNEELLKRYKDDIDNLILGDAADTRLLKANKISSVGTVVVAVPENIEIVAALLELGTKNIIARSTTPRHSRVLRQVGVDLIVSPENESGKRTALIAANSNFLKYSENFQEIGDDFVIGTTTIKNHSLNNKLVKDVDFNKRGVSLVLVKNNGKSIRPTGSTLLHYNDTVTLIGDISDVSLAFEWLQQE